LADDCIVVYYYEPIEFPFFKERTPTDSEENSTHGWSGRQLAPLIRCTKKLLPSTVVGP